MLGFDRVMYTGPLRQHSLRVLQNRSLLLVALQHAQGRRPDESGFALQVPQHVVPTQFSRLRVDQFLHTIPQFSVADALCCSFHSLMSIR
jgi:hypothetical protein